LISETRRTTQRLSALPIDGAPAVDLSTAERMVLQPSINAARTHVAFVSEAPDKAPEVFVSKTTEFQARQSSRVQQLPAIPIRTPEVVPCKSNDSREIEGLLTLPPDYQSGTRVPLLVIVHGGPTGVFNQGCIVARGPYPIAAFASRGYAVLRCNV